jgi:hypothetical protein
MVAAVAHELVEQISVRGVYLDTVESRLDRLRRRGRVVVDESGQLVELEGTRRSDIDELTALDEGAGIRRRDRRRSDRQEAAGLQRRVREAADVPKLQVDRSAFGE